MRQCTVSECENERTSSLYYCVKHYTRFKKYGDVNIKKVKGSKNAVRSDMPNQRIPGWNSWKAMKNRCLLKDLPEYAYYGGRGITICDRWLGDEGFKNFMKDMGDKPSPKHSIDRVDPNGNYEPSNCEWATKRQQSVNKRNRTRFLKTKRVNNSWYIEVWIRRQLVYVKDYTNRNQLIGAVCVIDTRWLTPDMNTKVTREVVVPY